MKIIWDNNESAAPVAPLETEAEIERFFAEMEAEIMPEEDDDEE